MPNWCFTNIIFHGSKSEIEDFHNKIEKWTSQNPWNAGFGNDWLGNVLIGAGFEDRIDSESDRIRCRGSITFMEVDSCDDSDEALLYVDTETAWAPMCKMWEEVINKLEYKTIGFSYIAEEPGMAVYEICDPYGDFPDRYYIDIYLEEEDEQNEALMKIYDDRYYTTEEEIVKALQKLLETEETDYKTLVDKAEAYPFKHIYSYLYIHKYEVVDGPEE